jgi:uncharacterized protein
MLLNKTKNLSNLEKNKNTHLLQNAIRHAWDKVASVWPIQQNILRNPLEGLESKPFFKAVQEGFKLFEKPEHLDAFKDLNRDTIKWCQAFYDQGQAVIAMPNRETGIFNAWRSWVLIENSDPIWEQIPSEPLLTIECCLNRLKIEPKDHLNYLTLMLTSLPGWSGYVKYVSNQKPPASREEEMLNYLAFRLSLAIYYAPKIGSAVQLFSKEPTHSRAFKNLVENEQKSLEFIKEMCTSYNPVKASVEIKEYQWLFCIDARSEPFRRQLEKLGNHETFGIAGFFGLPIGFVEKDKTTPSCPALMQPTHLLSKLSTKTEKSIATLLKEDLECIYNSTKYQHGTSFALAEATGLIFGLKLIFNNFIKPIASVIRPRDAFSKKTHHHPIDLDCIPLESQVDYAEQALKSIGLIESFSKVVIICGHSGDVTNNLYSAALNCGACSGNEGGTNARILAQILNNSEVRSHLALKGINVPNDTQFISALHNTTQNKIDLLECPHLEEKQVSELALQVKQARKGLENKATPTSPDKNLWSSNKWAEICSQNWAENRPEWGLSRHSMFVIGPRWFSCENNLHGQSFLHSYDYRIDDKGEILASLLNGPLVVAQMLNAQYLFSTMNNIAYGSGSKVTQNLTGRFAIMQGNASDLMYGLPLQSLYVNDASAYHAPSRLNALIVAPKDMLMNIFRKHEKLNILLKNEWIKVNCLDPIDQCLYQANTKLEWEQVK